MAEYPGQSRQILSEVWRNFGRFLALPSSLTRRQHEPHLTTLPARGLRKRADEPPFQTVSCFEAELHYNVQLERLYTRRLHSARDSVAEPFHNASPVGSRTQWLTSNSS
ncbi:unnamed protein product, partial [Mesorhabditis belari]|uniref:Uncharacterized protein n=1 Tax=Mesorhabditis belari TaxID=2138241 RepID=A0AAF3J5C8_9BILA